MRRVIVAGFRLAARSATYSATVSAVAGSAACPCALHQNSKCVQSALCPNGVFRLRLLDELGSPVCDFGQRADLGVRGTFGKDQVGWHRRRRLNLDTVPLSGVRTCLSSGNCYILILDVLGPPSSFVVQCRCRPCRLPNGNCQSDTLLMMPKRTTPSKPAPDQAERTHVTSGINLPVDVYQLLNRVAFARSLKAGGRPSVSGLVLDLVQRHRKELEKELDG